MRPVVRASMLGVAVTALLAMAFNSAFADLNPHLTFEEYYGYNGGGYPGDPDPSPSDPGSGFTTGTISGVVTDDSGAPLRSASILAEPASGNGGWHSASTDGNGRYIVDGVPAGTYIVEVTPFGSTLSEYVPRQLDYAEAGRFTVTAGHVTTANERILPVGTITGRFTDAHGTPESVTVSADLVNGGPGAEGHSDASGAYALRVFAGTYRIGFGRDNGAWQYAHGQADFASAAHITVAGGATVTVDETGLPTGSVSGRIMDNNGAPASGAQVSLSAAGSNDLLPVNTAADGSYTITHVPAGTYVAWISSGDGGRHQYYQGTLNGAKAAPITVVADQTTTVNDTFLPVGALTVTATDATTKGAVSDFCVGVWGGGADAWGCSNGTGTVNLAGLPQGSTYSLNVTTDDHRYVLAAVDNIAVTAGQTTSEAVSLQPAALIRTTVLDAVTHQPVSNVCVAALTRENPTLDETPWPCSDSNGNLEIDSVPSGTYNLLARPYDGVHGAQWLGSSGGVGQQTRAKQINAVGATTTVAPTIYLDAAGTISGTVRDAATGAPVTDVCVQATTLVGGWDRAGDCYGGGTDSAGRYTITNLGPYSWPLQYGSETHAWQWSGGSRDQRHAKLVKVKAGATVTVDTAMTTGTTIRAQMVVGASKTVVKGGTMAVVDADTGLSVGSFDWAPDGTLVVHVLPGPVRISYDHPFDDQRYWYRNAKDFAHATRVTVGHQDLTLQLGVPDN